MQSKAISIPLLSLLTGLYLCAGAVAQIRDPVKWSFSAEKVTDSEYDLVMKAGIEQGWHLYSQDLPGGGPIPTSFTFEPSPAYERTGQVRELSEAEVKYDPAFQMDLRMYSSEAVFRQRVRILSESAFTIRGYLEFMCCDDQSCLPPKEVEFSFEFPGVPSAAAGSSVTGLAGGGTGQVQTGQTGRTLPGETVKPPAGETVPGGTATPAINVPHPDPVPADGYPGPASGSAGRSPWVFFLVAFLAGLAAILTPCVFPMIPMTVTFFMRGSENRARAVAKGLVFGLSIIAIYTSLGFLVSLTSAGADVAGRLSTHWIPNLVFFLLFMVFAASFLGMFELVLPGSWVNRVDKQVDRGGYLASFFMAFTLVLVSFSCTGPIVGALLVESVGGLQLKPILGMFGFSLAFALPFTLLAMFPSWLGSLPKSGGWLNAVKVVLGFIVLAFGLKFLSTIDQTYHLGILSRDVYLAVWIVIFSLLGLYLLGKITLANDSRMEKLSVPRLVLAIAVFSFVLYLIPGLFGARLGAVSALLPPMTSQNFNILSLQGNPRGGSANAGDEATGLCSEPRYADLLELPYGLKGYFTYGEGLECAVRRGKPLLLDFKGHACSNCKEMEAKVWSDPRVLSRLREDYIIVALYTDDRTRLPESEWVTTESGRVLKTMGRVNARFEMERFNTNTQPLHVLLDHQGGLLAEPKGTDLNVQNYVDFLDRGLAAFRERQAAGQP